MKKLVISLFTLAAILTPSAAINIMQTTQANAAPAQNACDLAKEKGSDGGAVCEDYKKDGKTGVDNLFKNIINTLIYVIGILAVGVIIYGGFMYITSAGKSDHITKAKNIIIYAVVALIVAISAYAMVNFVLGKF